ASTVKDGTRLSEEEVGPWHGTGLRRPGRGETLFATDRLRERLCWLGPVKLVRSGAGSRCSVSARRQWSTAWRCESSSTTRRMLSSDRRGWGTWRSSGWG